MREIGQDTANDMGDDPEFSLDNCAYDLADCALYDSEIMAYCKKRWPGKDRWLLKEIIADYIV
jgi:hypothetical protein